MLSPVMMRRHAAILHLSDIDATQAPRVGGKAASLARARRAGLAVLDGFVLTPEMARTVADGRDQDALAAVRLAWADLSDGGRRPLVVRSSSAHEDTATSSMAGRFASVLDVRGWEAFVAAVGRVVSSAVALVEAGSAPNARMAVLVQPFVTPALGGVLFGADPITGRRDRLVVAAVAGGPDRVVSGEVDAAELVLHRSGRVASGDRAARALVGARLRRRLVRLAARVADVFDGPQDVEWAVVDRTLLLLQSRPITASAALADGPVLGPGPVAETFPHPLSALERDLWVEPLRDAIRAALRLAGAGSRAALDASPVVVTVGGRVAVDLELLGLARPSGVHGVLARLDPRPPTRRLRASWRVGRLRAALPALAGDLLETIDARLAAVPALETLDDAELLRICRRTRRALVGVHGHEILMGLLLGGRDDGAPVTAAAAALAVLAERGADTGSSPAAEEDAAFVARHPVLLALAPPRIGARPTLPTVAHHPVGGAPPSFDDPAVLREALRLRARWLQELSARAAELLGERLAAAHRIADPCAIRDLDLARVEGLVSGRVGLDLVGEHTEPGPPLPVRFRLTPAGDVVAVADPERAGPRGAGGGRGSGTVVARDALPAPGAVLVVRTLDPELAPWLAGLAGLVAETGSTLSHLAILARELGVPTVVGCADALRRFAPGTVVTVDGRTGVVEAIPDADAAGLPPAQEVAS